MDFSSIVSGPGSVALLGLVTTSDPKRKKNAVKGNRNFLDMFSRMLMKEDR